MSSEREHTVSCAAEKRRKENLYFKCRLQPKHVSGGQLVLQIKGVGRQRCCK